jgi:hypothetical protein
LTHYTISDSISVSTRACHSVVRAKAGFDSQSERELRLGLTRQFNFFFSNCWQWEYDGSTSPFRELRSDPSGKSVIVTLSNNGWTSIMHCIGHRNVRHMMYKPLRLRSWALLHSLTTSTYTGAHPSFRCIENSNR